MVHVTRECIHGVQSNTRSQLNGYLPPLKHPSPSSCSFSRMISSHPAAQLGVCSCFHTHRSKLVLCVICSRAVLKLDGPSQAYRCCIKVTSWSSSFSNVAIDEHVFRCRIHPSELKPCGARQCNCKEAVCHFQVSNQFNLVTCIVLETYRGPTRDQQGPNRLSTSETSMCDV